MPVEITDTEARFRQEAGFFVASDDFAAVYRVDFAQTGLCARYGRRRRTKGMRTALQVLFKIGSTQFTRSLYSPTFGEFGCGLRTPDFR